MTDVSIKLVIMAAISLLIGAIFIGVVASESYKKTSLTGVTSETVDITSLRIAGNGINESLSKNLANKYTGTTGWKNDYSACNIDASSYGNASTTFTPTTDYSVTSAGVLSLKNTVATNSSIPNTTYINYRYCPNDYVAGFGGSMMNITLGLMGMLLLGIGIGAFYQIYKDITG